MSDRLACLMLCAALACAPGAIAQGMDHHHHAGGEADDATATYGHVHFATSCSKAAEAEFENAVAAMHSFEYATASKKFQAVQQQDPKCAIAYWGEAMTLYHPLWGDPSKQDLKDGWALVQKAQKAKEQGPKEKAFIAAAAAFYKPGEQTNHERATAYSEAMEKLHTQFPDDEEGTVFYALSLLGAEPEGDTSLSYPKKAVAILNDVLAKDPDHPGVTHYIIHACDNPHMAQEGLAAAKKYASIAPSSPHALHMPSHIFSRVGLWQDSIHSNLAAIAAAKKGGGVEYQLHPMDFLMYAYLQTGQDDKARATEQEAVAMKNEGFGHGEEDFYWYVQAHFPAMLAIETRDWQAAESLQTKSGEGPGFEAMTYWANAVGAGHLKNVDGAKAAVEKFDAAQEAEYKAHPDWKSDHVDSEKNEAHAWLAYAEGKNDEAFALLQPVIERQDKVGKGEVELPAREMYAEMLLELNRPADALEQFKTSLQTDPNRFNGLYGAGKAAEMAGQQEVAATYYKQLLANCGDAGEQRAELKHAKEVVEKLSATANGQ